MAVNREWSSQYLKQQYEAMRWLAMQGFTSEEIREFRWGQVDETERVVWTDKLITNIRYDFDDGKIDRKDYNHRFKISYKGCECEYFFGKSKIPCPWMFTAHRPRSWRKAQSREALFPLEDVEKICKPLEIEPKNPLTLLSDSGNIEVSKLNIHISETTKQTVEGAF